jgi:hypothetical protein
MSGTGLRNFADVMSGNATHRRTAKAVEGAVNPKKRKKKKVAAAAPGVAYNPAQKHVDARARALTNERVDQELDLMFMREKQNNGLRTP